MNSDSLSLYHEGFARVKRGRQAVGKGKIGEQIDPSFFSLSSCHLSKRLVFCKFNVIVVVAHTNNARSIAKNGALTAGYLDIKLFFVKCAVLTSNYKIPEAEIMKQLKNPLKILINMKKMTLRTD